MEADITDLRNKLKECEKERLKAAQYGLQLLERQTELQNQLDKCHEEMMTVTENYNQEKYALQREVELKSRMLESLSCECETTENGAGTAGNAAEQKPQAGSERPEKQVRETESGTR